MTRTSVIRICKECSEPAANRTSLCAYHKRAYQRSWEERRKRFQQVVAASPRLANVQDIGGDVVGDDCRQIGPATFAVLLPDKVRLNPIGLRRMLLRIPIRLRYSIDDYAWDGTVQDAAGHRWGRINVIWTTEEVTT